MNYYSKLMNNCSQLMNNSFERCPVTASVEENRVSMWGRRKSATGGKGIPLAEGAMQRH